jgi:hypothetical protein
MDFVMTNIFHVKKQNHQTHFTISMISDWFFTKHYNTATNSMNGLANTVDMAEDMIITLDLQKFPINGLLE